MPSSWGSSQPRMKPESLLSLALAGGFFTTNATWAALMPKRSPQLRPVSVFLPKSWPSDQSSPNSLWCGNFTHILSKTKRNQTWHLLLRLHFHQPHVSAFLVHLCSELRVSKCHCFTTSEQWPLLWEVCGTCSGFRVFFRFVALLTARNLLFSSLAFLHLFYSFLSRRFPISLSHSRRVGGG